VDVIGMIKLKPRGHCRTPYLHEWWGTRISVLYRTVGVEKLVEVVACCSCSLVWVR
jgi:hypothetical protein